MTKTLFERSFPWLCTIGFFVLWQIVCVGLNVDTFILPSPTAVWHSFTQHTALIMSNALQTLMTTLAGFALGVAVGLLFGLLVGASPAVYDGLYPIMIGFNSIPKVAIVPVLVIWFGIGTVPAIITAFATATIVIENGDPAGQTDRRSSRQRAARSDCGRAQHLHRREDCAAQTRRFHRRIAYASRRRRDLLHRTAGCRIATGAERSARCAADRRARR